MEQPRHRWWNGRRHRTCRSRGVRCEALHPWCAADVEVEAERDRTDQLELF